MEAIEESHLMRLMNPSALMSPGPMCSPANTGGFHKVAEALGASSGFAVNKKRGLDVVGDLACEPIKFEQPLDFSKKPKLELDVGVLGSPTRLGSDEDEVVLNLCRGTEGRDNYMSDSGASSAASESPEIDRLRSGGPPHVVANPPPPPLFGLGQLSMGAGIGGGGGGPEVMAFPGDASSPVFPAAVQALQGVINGKGAGGKATRPFKAYPRDPLSISMGMYTLPVSLGGMATTEALINQASNDAYSKFRERMMSSVQAAKATRRTGSKTDTSPTVDRHGSTSPDNDDLHGKEMQICETDVKPENADPSKDDAYWERRRKNNEAAKRSRDARRAKEDEIAIRAAFLEQENLKLRIENAALKNETAKLRCLLYNS